MISMLSVRFARGELPLFTAVLLTAQWPEVQGGLRQRRSLGWTKILVHSLVSQGDLGKSRWGKRPQENKDLQHLPSNDETNARTKTTL